MGGGTGSRVGSVVYMTTSVPCDWAGAVMEKPLMCGEGGLGGQGRGRRVAAYMTTSVACGGAGAVMQKLLVKGKYYRETDQQTDTRACTKKSKSLKKVFNLFRCVLASL